MVLYSTWDDKRFWTKWYTSLWGWYPQFPGLCCHLYSNCSSAMQQYMIELTYLWSHCTKFHALYLHSCIWPDKISWCIRQSNSIKFCANLRKKLYETLAMIRQASEEESMSRTRVFERHAWFRADRNGKTGEEESQEHAQHFLWYVGNFSQRIYPGRPNSQFWTLLWHFMVNAWKCAKTSSWALVTKLAAVSWQCTISHFLLHPGICDPTYSAFLCFLHCR
jgi:hypothetical protein